MNRQKHRQRYKQTERQKSRLTGVYSDAQLEKVIRWVPDLEVSDLTEEIERHRTDLIRVTSFIRNGKTTDDDIRISYGLHLHNRKTTPSCILSYEFSTRIHFFS